MTKIDIEQYKKMYAEGCGRQEMADHFGVHRDTISVTRRKLKLPPFPKGEDKYSPEDLAAVEAMLDEGLSFSEIQRSGGPAMLTLRRRFPGRGWSTEQRTELIRALHVNNKAISRKHNTTAITIG